MSNHRKRHALGQHFLRDVSAIDQIVDQTLIQAGKFDCQSLLEIGPGKGAITYGLDREFTRAKGLQEFLLVAFLFQ